MAMILDAFIEVCKDKLSKVAEEEISMLLGVKDELEKLRGRMEGIGVYLESAEQRRHTDKTIGIWVKKLKDVMYDVDDIIDLCMIKGRRLLGDHPISESAVRRRPLSLFYCCSCIKFRHEIGSKIRKLNNRLNMILEDQSILSRLEPTRPGDQARGVNYRQTSPDVVQSDIVGTQIEEDIKSLVQSLIKEDNKKYQVLGIVGMGGIGKTTLASKIYNHESVKNNFPIRVWVCVSKDFSETELLKEIIRGAKGDYVLAKTKAELVPLLSSKLSKRYLIVLDDVWKADVWENLLRIPFGNATATSGRIVVTTRDMNVVGSMRGDGNTEPHIHRVERMNDDCGWEMLRKRIFRDDEEEVISSLKEIGVKIIKKCDGLPLAIKTIAGVLRLKEKTNVEWSKVLDSDVWSMSKLHEELPGALFLSYEYLSSDLKQCFLYCSLFREDYRMDQDDLIRCWVAEGFVKTTQRNELMEDVAEDYYKELIRRNLLQPCHDENGWVGDQDGNYCKIHDLLRTLGLFLVKDESTFLGDWQSPNIDPLTTKVRRLSMVNTGEKVEVPNFIKQQKCLRTLIISSYTYGTMMVENELFKKLRFLRVMNLSYTSLESLPDSVGDLLHLRYLNVYQTKIKELPESIGRLVNLQILNLALCHSLHTLPKAITKLCNLRCLRLERTPLTHVPKEIGKLKHLNHLDGFVIGHDDRRDAHEGCDLNELQSLSQLRFLEINRLERTQPAGAPVLANSTFLRTLILNCEQLEADAEVIAMQRIDQIYHELSPQSTHLQRLEVNYFFGSGFPSWMMSPSLNVSFPNLTKIMLSNCKSCLQLPPLGLLPELKTLSINQAHAIKTIGPEFLGPHASSAAILFPKLEELIFSSMSDWEKWSFSMVEGVGEERRGAPKLLPHLRELNLYECPKLRALPEGLQHATNLQDLNIAGAHNLREINNLPQLEYLNIEDCPRLEQVENLGKLQRLIVILCRRFRRTSTTDAERLPQWLLELLRQHSLQEFYLTVSMPLLKTFLKGGPNWPIIQPIPQVRIEGIRHTDGMMYFKYIWYAKDPPSFKTNLVESEELVD